MCYVLFFYKLHVGMSYLSRTSCDKRRLCDNNVEITFTLTHSVTFVNEQGKYQFSN